jgi:hypothetical protein
VFVTAWVVGLVVGPSAPAATAAATEVHAYYAEGASRILVQAFLVHGVAGIALGVLAVGIPVATRATHTLRSAVTAFGLAAAAASVVQFSLAIAATSNVGATAAATSRAVFQAINVTDTVKLLLLAAFVGAATAAARDSTAAPRWLTVLALALVVLLPLGGAAFLASSTVLTPALYGSLPLLLIWVGATSAVVSRRTH